MLLTILLIFILGFVPLKTVHGGLVLEENVEGFGMEKETLLEKVIPYHLSFGLQKLELVENQTIMAISVAQFEKACRLFHAGAKDQVKAMFKGATVLLYVNDLSCAAYHQLGLEYDREYHKLWCEITPMVISVDTTWFPGIFPNFKVDKDKDFMAWIKDGHPCYWLTSSGNVDVMNFMRTSNNSMWFKGSLETDRNDMAEILNAWPTQVFLRGFLPFLYLWSMTLALKGIRLRKKEKKTTFSFMAILYMNAAQSFLLTIGTFLGLNFATSILPSVVHVISISNFFGFSVATDMLFASILANVRRGMHAMKIKQTDSRLTLGVAGVLALMDLVSLVYFMATQTPTARHLVVVIMPAILTVVGFLTMLFTTNQVLKLSKLLRDDHNIGVTVPALVRLANTHIYWTKVALFSLFLTYTSLLHVSLGVWTASPSGFLITAAISHIGKVLNMVSQTKCCSLPSAKSRAATRNPTSHGTTKSSAKSSSKVSPSYH